MNLNVNVDVDATNNSAIPAGSPSRNRVQILVFDDALRPPVKAVPLELKFSTGGPKKYVGPFSRRRNFGEFSVVAV